MSGVQGGRQLAEHLGDGDHALFIEVPATLRAHLVFDMTTCDTGTFVGLDGSHDVHGVAIPGIGIGDQGDFNRLGDASGLVEHLGKAHQPEIGHPKACMGNAGAGHVQGIEPRPFHTAGQIGIVDAGAQQNFRSLDESFQSRRLGHGITAAPRANWSGVRRP